MTRDEIISMAREASSMARLPWNGEWIFRSKKELMSFAALVAAAERRKHQTDIETWKHEACKAEKWRGLALSKDPMGAGRVVQAIQREAMELEREACAQLCADTFYGNPGELNHELASAIRARSQQ